MNQRKIARIKRQLKRAGITQDRVALEVGVSRVRVNQVVNGRSGGTRVMAGIERLLAEALAQPPSPSALVKVNTLFREPQAQATAQTSEHAPEAMPVA